MRCHRTACVVAGHRACLLFTCARVRQFCDLARSSRYGSATTHDRRVLSYDVAAMVYDGRLNISKDDFRVYDAGLRESHAVILRDSCPGESGPIPRRAFRRPDEPGQLCTEDMTARDYFSDPYM